MIGVSLAWAVPLLFHPSGEGDQVYLDVQDEVAEMLAVHVGMILFIPLIAVAVYLLVRGVQGTAAQISRIALVPFVVFFSAWETLQGIATGILAAELNARPENERASGAALIQDFAEHPLARDLGVFASIGTLAILIAMIAAAIALRRDAGAPLSVAILLGLLRISDRRPSAALRTDRAALLRRRGRALLAKPRWRPRRSFARAGAVGVERTLQIQEEERTIHSSSAIENFGRGTRRSWCVPSARTDGAARLWGRGEPVVGSRL
jgi:hypothetical protein